MHQLKKIDYLERNYPEKSGQVGLEFLKKVITNF